MHGGGGVLCVCVGGWGGGGGVWTSEKVSIGQPEEDYPICMYHEKYFSERYSVLRLTTIW